MPVESSVGDKGARLGGNLSVQHHHKREQVCGDAEGACDRPSPGPPPCGPRSLCALPACPWCPSDTSLRGSPRRKYPKGPPAPHLRLEVPGSERFPLPPRPPGVRSIKRSPLPTPVPHLCFVVPGGQHNLHAAMSSPPPSSSYYYHYLPRVTSTLFPHQEVFVYYDSTCSSHPRTSLHRRLVIPSREHYTPRVREVCSSPAVCPPPHPTPPSSAPPLLYGPTA